MSEIPPNHPPFSPSNPPNFNLHYDDAGNAYHQDAYGRWVPHIGFAQVSKMIHRFICNILLIYTYCRLITVVHPHRMHLTITRVMGPMHLCQKHSRLV
jgi:hypothetical protein